MKRFWEIEHSVQKHKWSLEERKCEEYFESTVRRNSADRFIVKLLVKCEEMSRLGQSKHIAIRRFKMLERRLNHQPSLKREYMEFIHEYKFLGHMRELQGGDSIIMPHYYLSHHCVIRGEHSTTKLRIVFNAFCRTTSGISLNDALMNGPVLQQELFSVLLRF